MDYVTLSREEFDAVVTGELTHYSLWFEQAIVQIITTYFVRQNDRAENFERLVMWREGLTFQDKIEILRAMIPLFGIIFEAILLEGSHRCQNVTQDV